MAFDGFSIKRLVKEYSDMFTGGKISKIIQPNDNDIYLIIKNAKETYNLYVSANPSMAYTYITPEKGEALGVAPNFCMVLRKYIANGKIVNISQKGNERIIVFDIEHLDEMGDCSTKKLVFELMGKYSNIILCDDNDIIIDSIKRVSALKSSLREVLPKKEYFFPSDLSKNNPCECDESAFAALISSVSDEDKSKLTLVNFLINNFEGVSKLFAKEVVFEYVVLKESNNNIDLNVKISDLTSEDIKIFYKAFKKCLELCVSSDSIYFYKKDESVYEYTLFEYKSIGGAINSEDELFAESLYGFYKNKHKENVILQKSKDIINILNSHLTKDKKKSEEWQKEIDECENKDELKKYGELLNAFSHSIQRGKSATVLDYYTGENIEIPMDENKTVIENSNRYFARYNKSKKREAKLTELLKETEAEIKYLEEMLLYVSLSENSSDISQIRDELFEHGYIKKRSNVKEKKKSGKIKHYVYDNNYHIYVGKNNIQNEEVTFNIATGNDWWFHAKGIPGSHVIVKSDKDNPAKEWDMPDELFELCGSLAAINSSDSSLSKVEIDYTRKKHLKKVPEANKGMVIYHTYYSLVAIPDISRFSLTTIGT